MTGLPSSLKLAKDPAIIIDRKGLMKLGVNRPLNILVNQRPLEGTVDGNLGWCRRQEAAGRQQVHAVAWSGRGQLIDLVNGLHGQLITQGFLVVCVETVEFLRVIHFIMNGVHHPIKLVAIRLWEQMLANGSETQKRPRKFSASA